ncbi:MAG: 1,4-dihydroxy-2-naphthoate polyprenyltransferase [Ilumatobacteraceae bacterium]
MNVRGLSRGQLWIQGARPRTLPAAIAPVMVGAGAAVGVHSGGPSWWRLPFALIVSLGLQVGVNYANDYSDGVRGTDTKRVGPMRLVGSGAMPARLVKQAAWLAFAVSALAGLVIAATTSWWLLALGAVCIIAAWTYTGGPNPYGYLGLGEIFVFIFFGIVATVGTTYAIVETVTAESVIAAVAVGSMACALLVVNNLRDIPGDTQAGKRTLAVRLGDRTTRGMYVFLIAVAAVAMVVAAWQRPFALTGITGLLVVIPSIWIVRHGARGRDLIPVLEATGKAQLIASIYLAVGLAIGG